MAAYRSFTQVGFHVDALAGYATFNNQLQRQISIPGLQPCTASGSTTANQFLGQVEAGYKLGINASASAGITPFGRLQTSSVTQNAFTEQGTQSLSQDARLDAAAGLDARVHLHRLLASMTSKTANQGGGHEKYRHCRLRRCSRDRPQCLWTRSR